MSRDDSKWLGQDVTDNKLAVANFILQLESKTNLGIPKEPRYTYSSITSVLLNDFLLKPIQMFTISKDTKTDLTPFTAVSGSLPCNVFIVGMKNLANTDLQYNGTCLVLHKTSVHRGYKEPGHNCEKVYKTTLDNLFLRYIYICL